MKESKKESMIESMIERMKASKQARKQAGFRASSDTPGGSSESYIYFQLKKTKKQLK